MPRPKRGDVWNVRFDPAVGAEIQKVRPAVVLSTDSVGRLPLKSLAEARFLGKLGELNASQLDEIAAAVAACVGAP